MLVARSLGCWLSAVCARKLCTWNGEVCGRGVQGVASWPPAMSKEDNEVAHRWGAACWYG